MSETNSIQKARIATSAIFLVCGLGISSWAPMVPIAKERLQLNEANLGLLLLLLGAGAITMMPVGGVLSHKFGSRVVMAVSAFVVALALPFLIIISSVWYMSVALFIFGAAVGTLDVAMNSHAVQVQNRHGKHIMSSMHGLFSVGGLLGSLGLGFLMELGLPALTAAISISALIILIIITTYGSLLDASMEKEEAVGDEPESEAKGNFSWLRGSVIFLGFMCFAVFLSEGSMLDWSALFLKESRGVGEEFSGAGYAAFSLAMATMRLLGDGLVHRLSEKKIVIGGSLIAATGLFLAILVPSVAVSLFGFVLLGVGAANIVPVFFSEGGRLKGVPASVAIPAITTMGYAGQLAGPAIIGFIAHYFNLPLALGFSAALLFLTGVAYWFNKRKQTS